MSNSVNKKSGSCACNTSGKSDNKEKQFPQGENLNQRMTLVKNKILVLSGKGGVGKSTVAVNLSVALALAGMRVGLLDIDVHGPSIPKLLNLENRKIEAIDSGIVPIGYGDNLKVMSIGFLLQEQNDPVIWRGPMKYNVIKQFLEDVVWGELDFLVVDSPPGTGDEPLSIAQLLLESGGGINAVIVTTPQELALSDVRKSVNFCRTLSIPILGVVENMSGFVCPRCGETSEIFKTGGGERMAREMAVPYLGRVPLDPQIVEASDSGRPYIYHYARTETAKAFGGVIRPILEMETAVSKAKAPVSPAKTEEGDTGENLPEKKNGSIRIGVPVSGGRLAMHFGHCEQFVLVDVNLETRQILKQDYVQAPDHQPGLLPSWLKERGVNLVLAGGMGSRAQNLFSQNGIKVITGASSYETEKVVEDYLAGTLQTGENICDH
jgi:Mrp family chromosome partitioning ATPase/predicted Fe-Mo cluster-binding NifX family protein